MDQTATAPGHSAESNGGPPGSLDQAMQRLLMPLGQLLRRIEDRCNGIGLSAVASVPIAQETVASPETSEDGHTSAGSLAEVLTRRIDQLESVVAGFHGEVLASLNRMAETPPPAEETPIASKRIEACWDETWERIFFGDEICRDPQLAADRQQFLNEVLDGIDAARALAAQMMLAQTAGVDQLPETLKHVGEAYYHWRPRTTAADDPLETAIAESLTRRAEGLGLRNSIELVRPGDRFDTSRHAASGRGVEVVAVQGWVVLRDGNRVYTKASVSVK